VREAEFYLLKVRFSRAGFDHLIFGTPFSSYRTRICRHLKSLPDKTEYILGSEGAPCFDLRSGEISGRISLNPGKKTHQLIGVLLQDLYRPIRTGGLFAELFPDEHFDILSSPDRVHQVLRRCRRWMEAERIPAKIVAHRGNYSIRIQGEFSFLLHLHRQVPSNLGVQLGKLINLFTDSPFGAREAREKLDLPLTSFNRLINWSIEHGHIQRTGSGPSTKYRKAA
jgi:hypothetical protein